MGIKTLLAAVFALFPQPGDAALRESHFADLYCAGMAREVVLAEMGRADCISETNAIEIDWTENWHEGVGQALAYAAATGLEPGLVLVCRKSAALCLKHSLGAQETFGALAIRATIWECVPEDVTLADCRRLEIGQ